MNIPSFFGVLWRQFVAVALVLVLGVVAFIVAVPFLQKYTAQSSVLAASPAAQQAAALDPSKDPQSAAVSAIDLPSLATSATVLNRVAADLHIPRKSALDLAGHIKIRPPIATNVLPIVYTDRNSRVAVEGVNAVTRELVRYDREITTGRYDTLIHNLRKQLIDRQTALLRYDSEIAQVTAQDPYVTAETGTAALDTHLLALEQQRAALAATMHGDQASASIAGRRPDLAKRLAKHEIVQNDPVFIALKGQYGRDLAQLNNVSASYTSQFPGLPGLQHTVDTEQKSLNSAMDKATAQPDKSLAYVSALLDANKANAQLASDRAQLASIDGRIAAVTSHLSNSGGATTRIASLRRDRVAGEAAYADLQLRLAKANADRTQAETINSLVVIDTATSASLATFSQPRVIGLALAVFCLWLAITLAYLLDNADKRLRSANDIEELYGAPVLAPVG
ncbi:MAG: hypothetical protein NVS3B16_15130 [Vulcanimicrobiaceae bacterium]